jgi:hypothetical protein
VAIAVPAVIKEARRRRARRRGIGALLFAAAVVIATTWGAGGFTSGGGAGQSAVVRGETGWTLVSPPGFHQRAFSVSGWRWGARGVSIGNFSPLPTADSTRGSSSVPARGVLFQLYMRWDALESPIGSDVRLPLTLRDFPGFAKAPASYVFTANANRFVAVVGAGPHVSKADLHALVQTISSVRFRPLRKGEITGSGYVILKRPGAYPLGSVTRVDPHHAKLRPFYVIHDRQGLRVVGWEPNLFPGKRLPCDIRLNRAREQFFCPDGGRWDSSDNVIVNPTGATEIEPLERYDIGTSQGHLLVTESVQYISGRAPALARTVRACPNYQPESSSSRTS